MANLFAWLALAVGPLAKQVLLALGIGWVSYAGVSLLLDQVRDAVVSNYGAISGTTAQLLAFYGFGQAISIILGGFAAKAGLMVFARLGKVSG